MIDIGKEIEKIGKGIVSCPKNCEGITRKPSEGIIPRCLFLDKNFEEKTNTVKNSIISKKGYVVVGLNPGQSKGKSEALYYKTYRKLHGKEKLYGAVLEHWEHVGKKYEYYRRITNLLKDLGHKRPRLWTELVKCESKKKGKLNEKTKNTCSKNFLYKELDKVPEWPIFAVGQESYAHLKENPKVKDRAIIGIPHPTGSRGKGGFDKLLKEKHLKEDHKKTIKKALQNKKSIKFSKGEWEPKTQT